MVIVIAALMAVPGSIVFDARAVGTSAPAEPPSVDGGLPVAELPPVASGTGRDTGSSAPATHGLSTSLRMQPAGIQYEVPITIHNAQSVATPSQFDQMIVVDSGDYASLEASGLQNVEFVDGQGHVIPSWLESGDSSDATQTIYWVQLSGGLAAGASTTIYLAFAPTSTNLLNSVTTGEAPQLSSTYAEYDDGADVFPNYQNFAGDDPDPQNGVDNGHAPTGWYHGPGIGGCDYSFDNPNGWDDTSVNGCGVVYIGSDFPVESAVDVDVDLLNVQTVSPDWQAVLVISTSPTSYAPQSHFALEWDDHSSGCNTAGSGASFDIDSGPGGSLIQSLGSLAGPEVFTLSSANVYKNYSAIYDPSGGVYSTPGYLAMAVHTSNYCGSDLSGYWIRDRPAPPNGVMPSVAIGGVSSTETYSLVAQVVDSSGTPVADANVSVSGQTEVTNSTGEVVFELANGSYNVTGSTPGYLPVTIPVDVTSNETVTLTLARPYQLVGQIPGSHYTISDLGDRYNIELLSMFNASAADVYFDWRQVGVVTSTQGWAGFSDNQVPGLILLAAIPGTIDYPDAWFVEPSPPLLSPTDSDCGAQLDVALNPWNPSISVSPDPPVYGTPTLVTVELQNACSYPLDIQSVDFEISSLNVGGTWTSIGIRPGMVLAPAEVANVSTLWNTTFNASVVGLHHCVRVQLVYSGTLPPQCPRNYCAIQHNEDVESDQLSSSVGGVAFTLGGNLPSSEQVTVEVNQTLPDGWGSSIDLNGEEYNTSAPIALNLTAGAEVHGKLRIFPDPSTPGNATVDIMEVANGELIGGLRKVFEELPPSVYVVNFTESGLGPGTRWSVTLGGQTRTTTNSSLYFPEEDGTYAYSVGPVSNFEAVPASGTVTVSGGNATAPIDFMGTPYPINFVESGLPSGTTWGVTIGGTHNQSGTATVGFMRPSGSYLFSVGPVSGYQFSPSGGQVTVAAGGVLVDVTFQPLVPGGGEVAFSDRFPGPALNSSQWWPNSPVLAQIAAQEPTDFGSGGGSEAGLSLAEPSALPQIGGGEATWQLAGTNEIYGLTSRDLFVPPFTANLMVTSQSPYNGAGSPAAVFLTGPTATPLLAVFLGFPYLEVQADGQIVLTPLAISPATAYDLTIAVATTTLTVNVTGGGSSFQTVLDYSQPAKSGYYLTLATLAAQAPGEESATFYSDGVSFGPVAVLATKTWSLPVTVRAEYQETSGSGRVTTITSPVSCAPVVLQNNFTGASLDGTTGGGTCGGTPGHVIFTGLVTGIVDVSSSVSETFHGGQTETLGQNGWTEVGNEIAPSSPDSAPESVLVSIPAVPALQVSISPGGPITVDAGTSIELSASAFGGTGDYSAASWSLDSRSVSSTSSEPCAPSIVPSTSGEIGFELSCTFDSESHHSVTVRVTSSGYWFNVAVTRIVSSPAVAILVDPAVYCAVGASSPSSSSMTIQFSGSTSPFCQVSGLDNAVLTVQDNRVTMPVTVQDENSQSTPLAELPAAVAGVSYPFYEITLDGVPQGSAVEVDSQTPVPVTLEFPPSTPTSASGLTGTSFTIGLDPLTGYAILVDAVVCVFNAVGVWSALNSQLPLASAQIVQQVLANGVAKSLAKIYLTQAAALANSNPLTLVTNVNKLVGSILWAVVQSLARGAQAWLIGQYIEAFFSGAAQIASLEIAFANILGHLITAKYVLDAGFFLGSFIVTAVRGVFTQQFSFSTVTLAPSSSDSPRSFPSLEGNRADWGSPASGTAWLVAARADRPCPWRTCVL
jgi:hypothetical protein